MRLDLTNGDHGVQIQMQLQQQPGQLLPAKRKALNKGFQRKNKGEGGLTTMNLLNYLN